MDISEATRSPAWSIPVTVRVKRTWMTWWWSEAQRTNVTKRQRQNKDESRIISLSLFTLNHKRNSAKKAFIFCFCFTFSFNMFTVSFINVVFVHFLHSPFCSSLLLFSPFFFALFSPFFFFCISCFLIFFSIAVFVYLLFVVPQFSSLSFVLDLFCILLLYLFSHHLRIFFARKNSKISVVNFRDEIMSLFFEPSLLRCLVSCFFLFASSSFLVCSMIYWLLAFLEITFINLLLGSLQKKIIHSLSIIFLKKRFYWVSSFFAFKCVFPCMIFKLFLPFSAFSISFWKISCFFCLNLFVSVQKKKLFWKVIDWFSLLFLFTSSRFVLSLCVLSLCLLSLLLLIQLTKNGSKITCVLVFSFAQFFFEKKKTKT